LIGPAYVPRILVVEDDVMARNAIVAILTHEKYEVLEATSAEALRVSTSFDGIIDLLIVDDSLQETSGRPLAGQILESRPALRVLQFDAHAQDNLAAEVRQILKPLEKTSSSHR
jgi:DNA-binding response OmpR family regulator